LRFFRLAGYETAGRRYGKLWVAGAVSPPARAGGGHLRIGTPAQVADRPRYAGGAASPWEGGVDELILDRTVSDPGQVDLLAEAALT
jgi:hypothetical protein